VIYAYNKINEMH